MLAGADADADANADVDADADAVYMGKIGQEVEPTHSQLAVGRMNFSCWLGWKQRAAFCRPLFATRQPFKRAGWRADKQASKQSGRQPEDLTTRDRLSEPG